jgi:hypothetical protein
MIELSEFVRVAALRSRNFINEAMPTWKKLRPNTPLHVLAYIHFAEPPLAPVHPDLRAGLHRIRPATSTFRCWIPGSRNPGGGGSPNG